MSLPLCVPQVWYDDPESLMPKYHLAKTLGLRGVGPFTFDDLDCTCTHSHAWCPPVNNVMRVLIMDRWNFS